MATLTIDGTSGDDAIVITATGSDSGSYSINGSPAVAFSGVTQVVVTGECRFPASGSRTRRHAFTHDRSCPSAVRRTSPKCRTATTP